MAKIQVPLLDSVEFKEVALTIRSHPSVVRLDSHLVGRFGFLSRSYIQKMIREGAVLVNGLTVRPAKRIQVGDQIELKVPVIPQRVIEPEPIELDVVHEDEDILVINKPPNLSCHAGRKYHGGTLANAIIYHLYGEEEGVGRNNPGIVHRLDKNTSGVIVIAKNPKTHRLLGRKFAQRQVGKEYLSLVKGRPRRNRGVIDAPVGWHPRKRNWMSVRMDSINQKSAVTHYSVIERFQHGALVSLQPKTGRTHQLRIHMESIGHPMFGEDRYRGFYSLSHFDRSIGRQALHAHLLSFSHPTTEERNTFEAELPPDFRRLISLLREETFDQPKPESRVPRKMGRW